MNVNVSYNGFTLADAASCVMMRLPVPDLVWDMEALWKVWNEPLPAVDVPEAVPTDAQEEAEPVSQEAAKAVIAELEEHIRRQMPSRAKPVTYNGVTYPSLTACAKAFGLTASACSRRLQKGQPLDKKLKAGRRPLVPASEPEPKPDNTEAVRQAVTALPPKPNRYVDEGNGRRLRDCPCELDGRQYTSLDTAAVILDLTLGEAYRQVMERGKFLKGRVK